MTNTTLTLTQLTTMTVSELNTLNATLLTSTTADVLVQNESVTATIACIDSTIVDATAYNTALKSAVENMSKSIVAKDMDDARAYELLIDDAVDAVATNVPFDILPKSIRTPLIGAGVSEISTLVYYTNANLLEIKGISIGRITTLDKILAKNNITRASMDTVRDLVLLDIPTYEYRIINTPLDILYISMNDLILGYDDSLEVLQAQLDADMITHKVFNTSCATEFKTFTKSSKLIKYNIFMSERAGNISNIPSLDMPDAPIVKEYIIKPLEGIETLSELIEKVEECYDAVDVELPFQLVGINRLRRQVNNSSTFGIDVEVLLTLARLINKPLARTAKWKPEVIIDNKNIILATLGISDEETIIKFLDQMEQLRVAYGYNSFAERDEHNLIVDIKDCVYPSEDEMKSATDNIVKMMGITFDISIKAVSFPKFDRKESLTLIKLDAEIADVTAKRAKMLKLQALASSTNP